MSRMADIWQFAPADRIRRQVAALPWFMPGPVTVARAPGRLDVMGGIADYSGSLVCEMPLGQAAVAAAQRRHDGKVVCLSAQRPQPVVLDAAVIDQADPLLLRDAVLAVDGKWAGYVAGCVWWLNTHRGAAIDGVTLFVDSDVPLGGGVSSSAAIEVASMWALAAMVDVNLSPMQLAAACQVVENRVVGAPCGVMDQVTASMGQAGAMVKILCQPDADGMPAQVLGPVSVPQGSRFVGIHSGVSHDVSGDPYTDTRVAAFMGQKLLIEAGLPERMCDCLANVDPTLYRENLRTTLPETMTGRAFVDQYGSTHDTVTTVDPQRSYRVRAATDHHVLEMQRVTRFVQQLEQGGSLASAGELMYGSHRSYSECANLGHRLTDRLVALVRERGAAQGLYGAKITGGGSGGTVAMLVADTPEVTRVIDELRQQYEAETGRTTMLFEGTSPGAAAFGAVTFERGA